jgi:hypothetical protein
VLGRNERKGERVGGRQRGWGEGKGREGKGRRKVKEGGRERKVKGKGRKEGKEERKWLYQGFLKETMCE